MLPHLNRGIENRFLLSPALTGLIIIAEVVGGIWTDSLALLSDSAHVFLDLFALGLSFLALRISARPADDAHTYGYHRMEVLAALANGKGNAIGPPRRFRGAGHRSHVGHAGWATYVLVKKNEQAIQNFLKFSLFVWLVWLIPFITGMLGAMLPK